jgi:hypothetical protein
MTNQKYFNELKERVASAYKTLQTEKDARRRLIAAQNAIDAEYVLENKFGYTMTFKEIKEIAGRLK